MKLHQLSGYIQSIYLVEYDHGLLLLDGCCRADVPTIAGFITQKLGRPMTDLKMIVVTHMHPDHAGAAHKLRKLTSCRIVAAKRDQAWYSGLNGAVMYLTDIILAFWVAGRLGKPKRNLLYWPVLKADIEVSDGETLPWFDEWKVLEMPGHTDRDLTLWHTPTDQMYIADLIVKVKKRFIPPFPIFHPNKYQASVERLHKFKPDKVWLAHGGVVSLTEDDYEHLFDNAPETPKTHWRQAKIKAKQLLLRYIN